MSSNYTRRSAFLQYLRTFLRLQTLPAPASKSAQRGDLQPVRLTRALNTTSACAILAGSDCRPALRASWFAAAPGHGVVPVRFHQRDLNQPTTDVPVHAVRPDVSVRLVPIPPTATFHQTIHFPIIPPFPWRRSWPLKLLIQLRKRTPLPHRRPIYAARLNLRVYGPFRPFP